MPSKSTSNQPSASANDSDDDNFHDANDPAEGHQLHTPAADIKSLITRKNAYAKKRITMAEKLMSSIEQRSGLRLLDDDMIMLRSHLNAADKAVQAATDVVESVNHLLTPNDIDTYLDQIDDHSPRLLDVRARINKFRESIVPLNSQSSINTTTTSNISTGNSKIDNTFKPHLLDESATPAVFYQWKSHFLIYMRRNGVNNAPLDEKRLLLDTCLTPPMLSTLKRVCMVDQSTSIDDILSSLENHFTGSNNLMNRRSKFFNCTQRPDESIRQYVIRFREIGDYAQLDKLPYDDIMAIRLVTGICNDNLRTELLRADKQHFKSIHKFTLAWEDSKFNSNDMGTSLPSDSAGQEINKLSSYKSNKKRQFQSHFKPSNRSFGFSAKPSNTSSVAQTQGQQSNFCPFCGLQHQKHSQCHSRRQRCTFCNIFGHHVRVCRKKVNNYKQKKSSEVQQLDRESEEHLHSDGENLDTEEPQVDTLDVDGDDSDDGYVFRLNCAASSSNSRPEIGAPRLAIPTPKFFATFSWNKTTLATIRVLPDTGAAVSVLPFKLIQAWNLQSTLEPSSKSLKSVDGSHVSSRGTIALQVEYQGAQVDVLFCVCDHVRRPLISWHVLHQLGVIPNNFPDRNTKNLKVHNVSLSCSQYKDMFISAFPTVFAIPNKLNHMKGPPMHIFLNKYINWASVKQTFKPRPIPVPLREATKLELQAMEKKGIIVPVSSPSPFTSPLLVVPKKEGKVRLVIDYTELNKHVRRPTHPFPTVNEVKAIIPPNSKYFATLDATQGYWQIPLDEKSQLLTTFITPWGRYCYTRAPMGLASSGDEFCRRVDDAFHDIKGIIKVVDDILVFSHSQQGLLDTIHKVLQAASTAGITLSPDKLNISQSVSFLGLQISSSGIRPDPKHLKAISDFPKPVNRTDLRSFMGLVNQFSQFSKDIARNAKNLRPLLSRETSWHWDHQHEESFSALRKSLVASPVLKYFDPARETKLVTDASKLYGLGFALLQKYDTGWALIACGSRFINETEANYAICELEALAIVWAIRKCRIYLMGLQYFKVETDHRPLVSIFNSSRLVHTDNPRLVRLMHQVASYNFSVHWVPGRLNNVPDALSRFPVASATKLDIHAIASDSISSIADPAISDLANKANECPDYKDLVHALKSMSAHDLKKLPATTHSHVRAYASLWDRLSIDKDTQLIMLDNYRIVVPVSCRKDILNLAHQSHQGITRTKARVQSLYFWHGISNDIVQTIQSCEACQTYRDSQPVQPMKPPKMPNGPFETVSCDLFEFRGSHTITYVDRYSGWPLVAHFPKAPSSLQIIKVLSAFFRDFGVPVSIRHDGTKPFVSVEFKLFLKRHNIRDELSSAYNPRSNGHAEASVKAMKQLVKKCFLVRQLDHILFNQALLEWRNTPRAPGNLSPAEILFGRKLRTLIPASNYDFISRAQIKKAVQSNFDELKSAYFKFNFRKSSLPNLQMGDRVRIRNTLTGSWDKKGQVVSVRDSGLSYYVKSQEKTYLRNRRLLKKI